jgi:formylglycine-generating enzyme required for sulfatase activity
LLVEKLKNPFVLYPILGALIPTLVYLILGGPSGEPQKKPDEQNDRLAARTEIHGNEEKTTIEPSAQPTLKRKEDSAEPRPAGTQTPRTDEPRARKDEASPENPPYRDLESPAMVGFSLRLVLIKPGTFEMGSPEGVGDPNEHPQHEVTITRPFYAGESEVTQQQYTDVMDQAPSYFARLQPGEPMIGEGNTANYPVEQVSHGDALEFCKRLAAKLGLPENSVRLPTEAEWEFAARGGAAADASGVDLKNVAWYAANSNRHTHPVKTKAPNANNLYDMAGNVSEWCADWLSDTYDRTQSQDPTGPPNSEGSARRVLRGGSFLSNERYCRPTDRNGDDPDSRVNACGFRIVVDAAAAPQLPRPVR